MKGSAAEIFHPAVTVSTKERKKSAKDMNFMTFRRNRKKLPYFVLRDENKHYMASTVNCLVFLFGIPEIFTIFGHSPTRFAVISSGRKHSQ